MPAERMLALGRFLPKDLHVSVHESTRLIDPEVENQVDAIWETKKKKAEEEGRICYNGISYRLNLLKQKDDVLAIDFGLLEYKARQALQTIPRYLELPCEYHHRGCYSGATVRTSDGRYIVVELSGKSMNMHAVDMLGGIMEKPQEITTGDDVFNCLLVELEEEGRIERSDITELYLRAVFLTPNTHCCFYFEAVLSIPAQTLLDRFAATEGDPDIKSIQALTREEYMAFLTSHDSPTKQIVAGLMQEVG